MGHARALLSLENAKVQVALARQIVNKQLSVRHVEKTVHALKKPPQKEKKQPPNPDLMALQEEFIRYLGTKVSISGNQNKGIIKIHYFSTEELNQIFEKIKE